MEMMSVRAKFRVTSRTSQMGAIPAFEGGKQVGWKSAEVLTVKLRPVTSDDAKSENAQFWTSTPSGEITIGCASAESVVEFELEREFYVDFTPAG
jgi:hypothetical protein